jgi:hypothetical protein
MTALARLDVPLTDTNVYLGRWPFRHLPDAEPTEFVGKLVENGVTEAWAGSFDGLWQRDLAGVNERLAAECRAARGLRLLPFGSVNPLLPDWQEDVRRCHEAHQIRLHPNYHGYKLAAPAFAELLAQAAERQLLVQLVLSMEDERTQSALARVAHVDVGPLAALMKQTPTLRLMILNAFRALPIPQAEPLAAAGIGGFDIAMLEGVEGVQRLVRGVGLERVFFGSYFPFFYFESARLKMQESPLAHGEVEAIAQGNPRRIIAGKGS